MPAPHCRRQAGAGEAAVAGTSVQWRFLTEGRAPSMAAPVIAAAGMVHCTTASGVVIPMPATAAAEPAMRSIPIVTTRRVRGAGASLIRHS